LAKRLELLKETMPGITRVAILVKPDNPLFRSTLQALEIAAKSLIVELQQFDARGPNEFEAAFSAMTIRHMEAVVFQEDAVFLADVKMICRSCHEAASPLRLDSLS
jgi:putative tryptophan/tyrosine transport system substrate-binding protein